MWLSATNASSLPSPCKGQAPRGGCASLDMEPLANCCVSQGSHIKTFTIYIYYCDAYLRWQVAQYFTSVLIKMAHFFSGASGSEFSWRLAHFFIDTKHKGTVLLCLLVSFSLRAVAMFFCNIEICVIPPDNTH